MNLLDFMSAHVILAFIIIYLTFYSLKAPFNLVRIWIRHRNIVARGWPPEHLDADGDFKPEPDNDE